MSWTDCDLGEFVTLKRGYDLPKAKRKDGLTPVVSSSGITGWHNEAKAEPPGVVTGRTGTIGEVFFLDQPFWPLNTALYAIDFHGNDPKFVAYLLEYKLKNYMSDKAAVPGVDRNVLHKMKIRAPDLQMQQGIIRVISSYDLLIENYHKQIMLLEDAARLIYREWFVYFRFPKHEETKFIDGIPLGWSMKSLGEIASVTMGQSPKSEYYNENGEGLPFHQGVTDYGVRFVSDRIFSTKTTKIAKSGDILFSVRAPVGRLNYTLNQIGLGRGLAAIKAIDTSQSYLFYALKNAFFKEDLIGGGSIFAATKKAELEAFELVCPDSAILDKFDEIVEPMDKKIKVLSLKNQVLTKARNLLLPRLMDGRISA